MLSLKYAYNMPINTVYKNDYFQQLHVNIEENVLNELSLLL